ncbi:retropepsin-like aspartic protease family protein [Chitinilyticum litopenaei]|uniref:retropepsin-like aspartic protease family protein n=1 Tax=Chitinilyticum litopenaei TaxID=1121276 RepID=UPI00041B350D|nr:retropepsin-like aspartic protease [Chitinilyticum litopenaei]
MKRILITALLLAAPVLHAAEVTLIATMGSKAIFSINGQRKTLSAGQTLDGLRVLRIDGESASIEVDGKQRTLKLGQGYVSTASGNNGVGSNTIVMNADELGHFNTDLAINGSTVRATIDSGASMLVLSAPTAKQLGVSLSGGQAGSSQTANGVIRVTVVTIPQLRVGGVTLYDVKTLVTESNDPQIALIGNSVLSRFQIKTENNIMTLTKKPF